jgi:hypothetical protein
VRLWFFVCGDPTNANVWTDIKYWKIQPSIIFPKMDMFPEIQYSLISITIYFVFYRYKHNMHLYIFISNT